MNVFSEIVFRNGDSPEDGMLIWNWGDQFVIADEDGTEIDVFNVCGTQNIEEANKIALSHFKAIEESQ